MNKNNWAEKIEMPEAPNEGYNDLFHRGDSEPGRFGRQLAEKYLENLSKVLQEFFEKELSTEEKK